MDTLTHISLFSGIGCTELGLKLVLPIRTVAYVENDGYCRDVLAARMQDGILDRAQIYHDVRHFDGRPWRGLVDVVSGGFPCQDISVAGKGAGIKEGTRSGLWFEMYRIICEVRPRFILVENVAAFLARGLDVVLGALAEAGYDAVWTSIRASDVGAQHRRERVFLLAYGTSNGSPARLSGQVAGQAGFAGEPFNQGGSSQLADAAQERWNGCGDTGQGRRAEHPDSRRELWPLGYGPEQHEWEPDRLVANANKRFRQTGRENGRSIKSRYRSGVSKTGIEGPSQCGLGGVPDGRSHRVDRLKCLGNGIVPQQLAAAVIELLAAMESNLT